MPSKNKRTASRQAQLSGRRRRRAGRPRGAAVESPPAPSRRLMAQRSVSTAEPALPVAQAASSAVPPPQAVAPEASSRRRPARARGPVEPLPTYAHLGSELKRIGVLSAIMVIVLAALTFVLG